MITYVNACSRGLILKRGSHTYSLAWGVICKNAIDFLSIGLLAYLGRIRELVKYVVILKRHYGNT